MTRPFKNWSSWVIGFLESPEGEVICVVFQTAGVFLDFVFQGDG